MIKKITFAGLGLLMIGSPSIASAQTTSATSQDASFVGALTAFVQLIEEKLDRLIAFHESSTTLTSAPQLMTSTQQQRSSSNSLAGTLGSGSASINRPVLFGRVSPYPFLLSGIVSDAQSVNIAILSSTYRGNNDYYSLSEYANSEGQGQEVYVSPPLAVSNSHWSAAIGPSNQNYVGIYRIEVFDANSHTLLASSLPMTFPPQTQTVIPTNASDALNDARP